MRKPLLGILLWLGLVIGVGVGLYQFADLLRYIFLLRVPILIGLLMVALPFIATSWLRSMLRNLFVLQSSWDLALVAAAATFAGMGVASSLQILLNHIPDRFNLPPLAFEFSNAWQYGLSLVLAGFIWVPSVKLSWEENAVKKPIFALIGTLTATALLEVGQRVTEGVESSGWIEQVEQGVAASAEQLPDSIIRGYADASNPSEHFSALVFLLLVLGVYLLGYGYGWRFYAPYSANRNRRQPHLSRRNSSNFQIPALFYLLLILLILVILLSGLSFFLDYFRVPLLLSLLLISAAAYWLFRVDHFYLLQPEPQFPESNFLEVLEARLRLQDQPGETKTGRSLVVICAAGGGIQAAGWTAEVLTGLHEELGSSFTQAIACISSVSGGSVGTMYYLNGLIEAAEASDEHYLPLSQVFDRATQDGLDAIGWGLAYPDLWRIIGLPFFAPALVDRGNALETEWRSNLYNDSASLLTWFNHLQQGTIPIPVFNAIVVEDGSRLTISPMAFKQEKKASLQVSWLAGQSDIPDSNLYIDTYFRDFRTDYPNVDINVATAARLSATFPYVTPVCRNYPNVPRPNYHVADGGYFDNSGTFTAIQWLDNCVLPHQKALGINRVFFLEILPFPVEPRPETRPASRGWVMTTLGPLLAAFKTRDYTQTARNTVDVGDLKEIWETKLQEQNFKLEHFIIQFPQVFSRSRKSSTHAFTDRQGRYAPPLSWKLTQDEKLAIRDAWQCIKQQNLNQLKQAWESRYSSPS